MTRTEERDFRTLMDGLTRALSDTQRGKSPTPLTPAMIATLREIAGNWYNTTDDPLYNFGLFGGLVCDNRMDQRDYLRSVDRHLNSKALSQADDPEEQRRHLQALRLFFEMYAEEHKED